MRLPHDDLKEWSYAKNLILERSTEFPTLLKQLWTRFLCSEMFPSSFCWRGNIAPWRCLHSKYFICFRWPFSPSVAFWNKGHCSLPCQTFSPCPRRSFMALLRTVLFAPVAFIYDCAVQISCAKCSTLFLVNTAAVEGCLGDLRCST